MPRTKQTAKSPKVRSTILRADKNGSIAYLQSPTNLDVRSPLSYSLRKCWRALLILHTNETGLAPGNCALTAVITQREQSHCKKRFYGNFNWGNEIVGLEQQTKNSATIIIIWIKFNYGNEFFLSVNFLLIIMAFPYPFLLKYKCSSIVGIIILIWVPSMQPTMEDILFLLKN